MPGARQDGRAYIAEAVSRGAAAVLAPEGTAWPQEVPGRPLVTSPDPRRSLALMAAAMAGAQPATVVAVTGTNGKTSTVDFLRQLWTLAGRRAASLGTLGLIAPGFPGGESLTTPDPVALHGQLAALARAGIGHAAIEASSHGIEQRRLDGVRLAAAGFTNLTRDHLDYHGDMEAYRAAKLRLFGSVLDAGGTAVANADMDAATLAALRGLAARRGFALLTVGEEGEAIRLTAQRPLPDGQALEFTAFGRRHALHLPLPGRFQADNALLALALAVASGTEADAAAALLPRLLGVRGRMELAAKLPHGAAVYVDYAHTPDALERLLGALRPHVAPAPAACRLRRRRRPRPGQAAADGRRRRPPRRPLLGHRRQSPQRGPGRDPRRRPGRLPRRHRGRRPPRRHRRRAGGPGARAMSSPWPARAMRAARPSPASPRPSTMRRWCARWPGPRHEPALDRAALRAATGGSARGPARRDRRVHRQPQRRAGRPLCRAARRAGRP